jgi:hypothetical protein
MASDAIYGTSEMGGRTGVPAYGRTSVPAPLPGKRCTGPADRARRTRSGRRSRCAGRRRTGSLGCPEGRGAGRGPVGFVGAIGELLGRGFVGEAVQGQGVAGAVARESEREGTVGRGGRRAGARRGERPRSGRRCHMPASRASAGRCRRVGSRHRLTTRCRWGCQLASEPCVWRGMRAAGAVGRRPTAGRPAARSPDALDAGLTAPRQLVGEALEVTIARVWLTLCVVAGCRLRTLGEVV